MPVTSERAREKNLWKLYRITTEAWDDLLAAQGGVCAVCAGPPMGKGGRYHTDHCHISGRVRGLLCHKCNVALGMVNDDPDRLRDLIAYLELHRSHHAESSDTRAAPEASADHIPFTAPVNTGLPISNVPYGSSLYVKAVVDAVAP